MRHRLPAKIDAVSYGVSLVREDTQTIRADPGTVHADLGSVRAEQARHGELLEQILQRLPDSSK
jgi:hypothetical protein